MMQSRPIPIDRWTSGLRPTKLLHVSTLQLPAALARVRRVHPLMGVALLIAATTTSGCDRVKRRLDREAQGTPVGDPVWNADSSFLANAPSIVFRVFDHPNGRAVVPVASIGPSGFRELRMGIRGWKALDASYLYGGSTLHAIRDGRVAGEIKMTRGQWESGAIDSLPGCASLVPIGLTQAGSDIRLAITGTRPTIASNAQLPPNELQGALAQIPTLLAPSMGISTSLLAKYAREVHIIPSGIGDRPSILVLYTDSEQVSDTLRPVAQRPRQLIVVLDKGNYGFRPSYSYTTLGNALTPPKLSFLDYMDVNADGRVELFFSFTFTASGKKLLGTQILRYENEQWRDVLRDGMRCQS